MRIGAGNGNGRPQESVDLKKIYENAVEKYNTVFLEDFGESGVFMFRPLGRKEFRELIESDSVSDWDKQEIICEACVVYPVGYDFANCEEAGLPSRLSDMILDKSLLKKSEQLDQSIHYFRDKLSNDINEQITCVIHEAFPEFSIEEISNWDVVRTAEYMTKSEYILSNLRGVPLVPVERVPADQQAQPQNTRPRAQSSRSQTSMEERFQPVNQNPSPPPQSREQEPKNTAQSNMDAIKALNSSDTPDKWKEWKKRKAERDQGSLADLQRRAPVDSKGRPIDWFHDSISTQGIEALKNQDVDERPVAERGLGNSELTQEMLPEAVRDRFRIINEK